MHELHISLLREKFVIHDPKADPDSKKKPVIALSNRIVLELENAMGELDETFIIRAQNMHSCIRLCARLVQSYDQGGSILRRQNTFDWEAAWDAIVNDYEYAFNDARWAAVYNKGKVLFESGGRHPLLDLIEKCDAGSEADYDNSIVLAEEAFKQTGKVVKIEYDGNVALVVNLEQKHGRCAIILRNADRTTTFNFSATAEEKKSLNFPQCLGAAAAFLEGIQLAFLVGMGNEKIRLGLIERHSREEKQHREGKKRLSRLSAEIASLEAACEVRYRPERPEFQHTVMEAEKFAQKVLEPPPEEKDNEDESEEAEETEKDTE